MKKNKLIGVILCAGKGTRIKNLVNKKPKTLLEILGKPIINYQIEILKKSGIKEIVIVIGKNGGHIKKNIHLNNYSDLKIKFFKDNEPKGCKKFIQSKKLY